MPRLALAALVLAAALLAAAAAPAEPPAQAPAPGRLSLLPAEVPPPPVAVVCLDPGHGGKDRGAGGMLLEKDLSLAVCRRVKLALEARGYKVYLTREDDIALPVEERTGVANWRRAEAFVSVHADYGTTQATAGPRIYSFADAAVEERRKDAPPNGAEWGRVSPVIRAGGAKLARAIAAHLEAAGSPAALVREAPLLVLSGARCPAALVEVGVLPAETAKLSRPQEQNRLAETIARGIDAFLRPEGVRLEGGW